MHLSALQLSEKWYKKAQKGEQLIPFDQIQISGKWGECISKTSIWGAEDNCRSAPWLVQSGCSETETLPFKKKGSLNSSYEVGNAPVESEIKPLFKIKAVSGFGH